MWPHLVAKGSLSWGLARALSPYRVPRPWGGKSQQGAKVLERMNTALILPKFKTWESCSVAAKPQRLCISYCSPGLVARWHPFHSTPPTEVVTMEVCFNGQDWACRPGCSLPEPISLLPGAFSASTILGTLVTELSEWFYHLYAQE